MSNVIQSRIGGERRIDCSEAEWKARVDLAAGHRLVALHGWSNLVYNHYTARVPGEPAHFLVKPNELGFDEVTASSLVKVHIEHGPVDPKQEIQVSGYNIHTAVLEARSDIGAVLHVHTEPGMAIAAQRDGLLPLSQTALRFYKHIGRHEYEGFAEDKDERQRIARDLGRFKSLLMVNHGLLTCGRDVCEAFVLMKFLIAACDVQLRIQASGAPTVQPPEDVCFKTAERWNDPNRYRPAEWPALLRFADRHDPSFRE